MAKRARIWLNRPLEDSVSFSAELAVHGIETIVAPVVHITPKPFKLPSEKPDALLLTSRHAAPALAQLPTPWRALPTYCVGAATANAATELGGTHIIPGSSSVLALLPQMAASMKANSSVLYLAGEERSVDVAPLLEVQSIHVTTCEVYRATAEPHLTEQIRAALNDGSLTGVAFFSSRSAKITCDLLTAAGLADMVHGITAFCLSIPVAQEAGKLTWAGLHACHAPTRDAMRELIVS